MRNLFDQYSQPENRFTHALLTALNEDRKLLNAFLRELVKLTPPVSAARLSIFEQRFPGEEEPRDEEELERRGIPDGWICDEDDWCVFIETKVMAAVRRTQIERHRRTAERRGFRSITALVITAVDAQALPPGTVHVRWSTIYTWLHKRAATSAWAARTADYLEIAEARLIERRQFVEGTLTTFAGFPFSHDHPFTYLEGKRLLGLALEALRARSDLRKKLRMNPKVEGRGAITGRQGDLVWDYLSLSNAADAKNFTKYPHLTLGVTSSQIEAMVTFPHRINTATRQRVRAMGEEGFREVVQAVVREFAPLVRKHKGIAPWFRGVQRRYPTQRSTPILDARIDFDLRTAIPAGGPPKTQPVWLSAAYSAFANKAGSNYQILIGALLRYDRCPELQEPGAIDLIARSWLACKPFVEIAE